MRAVKWMKIKGVVFVFFIYIMGFSFSAFGKEFIVLRSKPHGMFSVFHFVLFYIQEYERDKIAGLNVDFEKTGLYYDEKIGLNWWEYYFEPVVIGGQDDTDKITIIEENTYIDPDSIEFSNSLEDNHNLIKKYIKIKPHILNKVKEFQEENFGDAFVIGIHYRGTDKIDTEAPRVTYRAVVESINKIISNIPKGMDYKIFIATDEFRFLHFMKYRFHGKVCCCEVKRATGNVPLHLDQERNHYQTGEDALIDAVLLSSVNFLIRTSSNLSLCSRYFNPQLPVIELSQRIPETLPCAEFYP